MAFELVVVLYTSAIRPLFTKAVKILPFVFILKSHK